MHMTTSMRARLTALAATIALVATAACSNTPSAPTVSPTVAQATPSVVSTGNSNAPADLARCLSGIGDAGCFTGRSVRASSAATAPVTSAPTLNPPSVVGTTVTLTWVSPVIGFANSYNIEASSTPGGPSNLANFNTGNGTTTITVPGVPNGTYYVRLRAVDSSGFSAPSNEIIVVVGPSGGGGCATAPRNLSVVSQSAGVINIAWSAPATGSATSFVIQAGSAPGRSDLANFDTGNTALSFVASGVPAGSYYVRLYARSSCGLSAASNEVLVFVVGFTSDVQVSVSWDAPSDVDLHLVEPSGNEIYYGSDTSSTGGNLDVDSNPACSIDGRQIENIRYPTGRAPGGTYRVIVDYWTSCSVARTNYLVTVKNGAAVSTFPGFFTGGGDNGGTCWTGSTTQCGTLITTFVRAGSTVAAPVLELFRAPAREFTPSAEKLRISGAAKTP